MRVKLFKLLKLLGVPAFLRYSKTGNLTVLSLHRISYDKDYFFQPIKPQLFESLLKYVQEHYTVISFSDIDSFNLAKSKPPLILSFDDGYYDFMEYALPLLQKYNMPSNHNVVNECLSNNAIIWTQQLNDCFNFFRQNVIYEDKDLKSLGFTLVGSNNNWNTYYLSVFQYLLKQSFTLKLELIKSIKDRFGISSDYRMMNWDDALEALKNKVEIGSHSYRHDSLNTLSSKAEMDLEIGRSKTELEEKLKQAINIIAFPNGQYNKSVERYCEEIGFKHVLLVNDAVTPLAELKAYFLPINRINLENESKGEMISRVELFHSKLRALR